MCFIFPDPLFLIKRVYGFTMNKLNIQKEENFIIKYKPQILILHIQKYYLTKFHHDISTIYVDNKIYILIFLWLPW